MTPNCVLCHGYGVLVYGCTVRCDHTNHIEIPCPNCATEREIGPEPEEESA